MPRMLLKSSWRQAKSEHYCGSVLGLCIPTTSGRIARVAGSAVMVQPQRWCTGAHCDPLRSPLLPCQATGYRVEVATLRRLEFENDAFAYGDKLIKKWCVCGRVVVFARNGQCGVAALQLLLARATRRSWRQSLCLVHLASAAVTLLLAPSADCQPPAMPANAGMALTRTRRACCWW